MSEAILEQDQGAATDASAERRGDKVSDEAAGRPSGRVFQALSQRNLSADVSFAELVSASFEHSTPSTKWLHVLSLANERFDVPDPAESPLLCQMYVPQETWTVPRFFVLSDSEPEYFAVHLADSIGRAMLSQTTSHQVAQSGTGSIRPRSFWCVAETKYRRLRDSLTCLLEDVPIEDGMCHPADELIARELRAGSSSCIEGLSRVFYEFYLTQPARSAAILRCMARVDSTLAGAKGLSLARQALSHTDIEVREAAVRAFETWGGVDACAILAQHEELEPWLREYVGRVIDDLEDTTL